MRFHVVGLPSFAASTCAYSGKVERFCRMMSERGHTVFAYLAGTNDAVADEVITCVHADTLHSLGIGTTARFEHGREWATMNAAAIEGIRERAEPQDFVCLIAGQCQKPIADALPHLTTVEFGIGYAGTFAKFRVFESSAWMHCVYASQQGAHAADGSYFDEVIPNSYFPDEFEVSDKTGSVLYLARMLDRKGAGVAAEICERAGRELLLAGDGPDVPAYGTHLGAVGPERRRKLLGEASVLIQPTRYLEPFGGNVVEAHLSGTPTLVPPWGAFLETVEHGWNGYHCRSFGDYAAGIESALAGDFNSGLIRATALDGYSTTVVGAMYERYFDRLGDLWGDGWYSSKSRL